jgi:hypothetical protein
MIADSPSLRRTAILVTATRYAEGRFESGIELMPLVVPVAVHSFLRNGAEPERH